MVKDTIPSAPSRESPIKKRRKTGTLATEKVEVNIYKRVVEFEENEATHRTADNDATLYFKTCDTIRDLLADMYNLKKMNNAEVRPEISEKCRQACVLITVLKKLNRLEKIRAAAGREALAVEKQRVDSTHLQYQNLCYEADHLHSEFIKCLQFKSKDEEIELVPTEEFYREAPESIVKDLENIAESPTQKHQLHLARLEWELSQRKQLSEMCKTLELEKEKLSAGIVERKSRLEGLGPRLAAVLEATKPLQEHLGLPVDKVRAEHKLANLLPDSLYLFYAKVDAYQQVYGNDISVVINGDKEEAEQWIEAEGSRQQQMESDDSDQEAEQTEEAVETKKRRHHKVSISDRLEEKRKYLLQVHPLSIHLTVTSKESPKLNLTFSYRPQLKIITVTSKVDSTMNLTGNSAQEVLTGESVVAELFPGDLGLESPNPSNVYQLRKLGMSTNVLNFSQLGHAYEWAQRICGLDFLVSSKSDKAKQSDMELSRNVEVVMKALKQRLNSRILLAKQLQQLDDGVIPNVPESIQFQRATIFNLVKWSAITWQQYCDVKSTAPLIEYGCVSSTDLFYSASFVRGKASMTALVALKNNYPITVPILSLTMKYNGESDSTNSDEIRDMERAVNVGWEETACSASWLLSAQLKNLCSYLDVYIETLSPQDFRQNTVFFKSVRSFTILAREIAGVLSSSVKSVLESSLSIKGVVVSVNTKECSFVGAHLGEYKA